MYMIVGGWGGWWWMVLETMKNERRVYNCRIIYYYPVTPQLWQAWWPRSKGRVWWNGNHWCLSLHRHMLYATLRKFSLLFLKSSNCLWFLLLFNCSREIHVNQSKVKQIVVLSSIRNYSPWNTRVNFNIIFIESLMKTKNIIILMRQSCWYCQKLIEIILFQLTCFTKSGAYIKMYPGT